MDKTYRYKVSKNGTFLGYITNVLTDFGYSQEVNSAGAQLTIKVSLTTDNARDTIEAIQTEQSADVTSELSESLLIERQPDMVGEYSGQALIRNDNDIEVIEFSSKYPNGHTVFKGFISKWKASFDVNDTVEISCISNGADMDNYIVQAGGYTLDVSQDTTDSYEEVSLSGGGSVGQLGQTFKFATAGNAGQISINMKNKFSVDMYAVFEFGRGTPNAVAELYSSNIYVIPADHDGFFDFSFWPTAVDTTTTYFFTIQAYEWRPTSAGGAFQIRYDSTQPYTNGAGYSYVNAGSGPPDYLDIWQLFSGDLTFRAYLTGGSIVSTFNNQDPSDIVRQIIDDYTSRGGLINYSATSIDDTLTTVDYEYSVNSVLEGVNKALTLAPANWYWTTDVATNILTFKEISTTADYTLVNGRDITGLSIEASIEKRKNVVYFTGGLSGSTNVFVRAVNTEAVSEGQRISLARITDNRVKLVGTATTIAQNYLDQYSEEAFTTSVEIVDGSYRDISLFKPGQTIGFSGFGNFIDNLILMVVRITRTPDKVTLDLGVLPHRATAQVEAIQRALTEIQTVDNPSVPE